MDEFRNNTGKENGQGNNKKELDKQIAIRYDIKKNVFNGEIDNGPNFISSYNHLTDDKYFPEELKPLGRLPLNTFIYGSFLFLSLTF